jgi:hypothetical protein
MEREKGHGKDDHDDGAVESLPWRCWRLASRGEDTMWLNPNRMHRSEGLAADIEALVDKARHAFFHEGRPLANLPHATSHRHGSESLTSEASNRTALSNRSNHGATYFASALGSVAVGLSMRWQKSTSLTGRIMVVFVNSAVLFFLLFPNKSLL